jgi:hypothetical protein
MPYADYATHSDSKQKTIAKRIKLKAIARGRLYPRVTEDLLMASVSPSSASALDRCAA